MIITPFGDAVSSSTPVFRWNKDFKGSRATVEDDYLVKRLSTSKTEESVAKVRFALAQDRRLTFRMIGHETSMSTDTVNRIVTKELGMRKICAKLMPKNLSVEQKEDSFFISQQLLNRLITELNFMHKVITDDE
ncbi:hypothetical protein Trydic_g13316 [Trypoxylus dichotomus]